jgi:hypothetical protein
VQQAITSGTSSTVALHGSTETAQFEHKPGPTNGRHATNLTPEISELEALLTPVVPSADGCELMPSGD